MDVSRRRFLQTSGLLLATAAAPWPGLATEARLPILQGMTDDRSTSIIIHHPSAQPLHIKVQDAAGQVLASPVLHRMDLPGQPYAVSEVFVGGLLPGQEYRLSVFDGEGNEIDRRRFGALNVQGTKCRFAVISCMNDKEWDQDAMWEAVANTRADFLLLDGDTVYADQKNPGKDEAGYARRYSDVRRRFGLFQFERLVPCFATWDDHDFGDNNADKNFPMAGFTRQLFRSFWGNTFNSICRKGFGVGSVLELCGHRFYLMDDRSFRDLEGARGGRHWGDEQWQWLLSELNASSKPAFLVNGSQFFGGYMGKESFEADHPEDFKYVLRELSQVPAPVAFISGDVHFSEIMAIEPSLLGYSTFEFTSSSLHSATFPDHDKREKNPRRLMSEWQHNFFVIESDVNGAWTCKTKCVLEASAVAFEHAGVIGS